MAVTELDVVAFIVGALTFEDAVMTVAPITFEPTTGP